MRSVALILWGLFVSLTSGCTTGDDVKQSFAVFEFRTESELCGHRLLVPQSELMLDQVEGAAIVHFQEDSSSPQPPSSTSLFTDLHGIPDDGRRLCGVIALTSAELECMLKEQFDVIANCREFYLFKLQIVDDDNGWGYVLMPALSNVLSGCDAFKYAMYLGSSQAVKNYCNNNPDHLVLPAVRQGAVRELRGAPYLHDFEFDAMSDDLKVLYEMSIKRLGWHGPVH